MLTAQGSAHAPLSIEDQAIVRHHLVSSESSSDPTTFESGALPLNRTKDGDMGISLYYSATQADALTEDQDAAIKALVGTYGGQIHELLSQEEEVFEDFYVYDTPYNEAEVFAGATGLPRGSIEGLVTAVNHWGELLGRIRSEVLPEAEWDVSVDGAPLKWDPANDRYTQ